MGHILDFIPPISQHILVYGTYEECLGSLSDLEIRALCYFGPLLAFKAFKAAWSSGYLIWFFTFECVLDLLPEVIRIPIINTTFRACVAAATFCWPPDSKPHSLGLKIYETITYPLNHYEICIARRKRDESQSSLPAYKYIPLKSPRHIRVLELKKKCFFSEPSCELRQLSLDDAPAFEALSYTWGVSPPSIPLEVTGSRILVTSAVEEFLFHQRSFFRSKLFWIDSVCINQNDDVEKTEQLPLMTEIYRRARLVIVWLGPPGSAHTANLIGSFLVTLTAPHIARFSTNDALENFVRGQKEAFVALGELFSHPWFERIWIIQEVIVSNRVHVMYKGICLSWDTIATLAVRLDKDVGTTARLVEHLSPTVANAESSDPRVGLSLPMDTIRNIITHWGNAIVIEDCRQLFRSGQSPLAILLYTAISFKSKDPRDKIFALFGISSDAQNATFKPSYEDANDLVFLKATIFILSTDFWFTILLRAGRGYERAISGESSALQHALPSWVPDYGSDNFLGARTTPFSPGCLKNKDERVNIDIDSRTIQLRCAVVDTIQHLYPRAKTFEYSTFLLPHPKATFRQQRQYVRNMRSDGRQFYLQARQLAREHSIQRITQVAAHQEFWELCMDSDLHFDDELTPPFPPFSLAARKIFEFFYMKDLDEIMKVLTHRVKWPLGEDITMGRALEMELFLSHRYHRCILGKAFVLHLRV
ncbi:hypothetical protein ACEPPN_012167 [Leptodophora sp. 'Broadleaf-Isolate-01']